MAGAKDVCRRCECSLVMPRIPGTLKHFSHVSQCYGSPFSQTQKFCHVWTLVE